MHFKHILPALEVDLLAFPMEWSNKDGDMPHSDATINFSVNIESREYGIKSIFTITDRIAIHIDDRELGISQFDPSAIDGVADDQWEILDVVDFENKQIIPDRIELDWDNKRAYVYYG